MQKMEGNIYRHSKCKGTYFLVELYFFTPGFNLNALATNIFTDFKMLGINDRSI